MVQREKASLWRMKQLLTKFRGDETWVPCGNFQTKDDISLFGPMGTGEVDDCGIVHENDLDAPLTSEQSRAEIHATDGSDVDFQESKPEESTTAIILGHGMGIKDANVDAGDTNLPPRNKDIDASGDIVMEAGLETNENLHEDGDEHGKKCEVAESNDTVSKPMKQILDVDPSLMDFSKEAKPNGESDPVAEAPPTMDKDPQEPLSASLPDESGANGHGATRKSTEPVGFKSEEGKWVEGKNREEDGEQSQPAPHRMTTRAQAQAASDNTTSARTRSPSPASSTSTFVHPFFLVPSSAHPDRDFGLPPAEAEDTRRVLMSYVQKQEEVCRGAGKLYEGLLRADRMRKTVLKWCKAEAHVGEMSDGEDWYDKEEWSLDEDLKKGHEEEEDESANQGKKTRGRRA